MDKHAGLRQTITVNSSDLRQITDEIYDVRYTESLGGDYKSLAELSNMPSYSLPVALPVLPNLL